MKRLIYITAAVLLSAAVFSSCTKEENKQPTGVVSFTNPLASKNVSPYGETITFDLEVQAAYKVRIDFGSADKWATIFSGAEGEAGSVKMRVLFDENKKVEERALKLYVKVDGFDETLLAEIVQSAAGVTETVKKNIEINTYMHEILKKDYLWADEYSKLTPDLTVNFSDYLNTHLTQLGDVNIEDGGYAKAYASNPGERFIYSYFQEVTAVQTKASSFYGIGVGPFFSSDVSNVFGKPSESVIGLSVSYVHQSSPAANAGLKRGDTIYSVNGSTITKANYKSYMTSLYASPSGVYNFKVLRFDGGATPNSYDINGVNTGSYVYSPVLCQNVLLKDEHKIGYLVLETFDLSSQEILEHSLNQFVEQGITDLVLDLRFNAGGSVAQSRFLASAIAGRKHDDDIFVKVAYNDGKTEDWKFSHGYSNDTDNLGKGPDLGLERVYIISSYNTASASELIINGLRGVDFPVYLYGGTTEGKNVGMTAVQQTFDGRKYEFAPITFRVSNAKGYGAYPDGLDVDEGCMVNNQNNNTDDDADNLFPYSFGDWTDFDFNIALSWIYSDIVGETRPVLTKSSPVCPEMFEPMEGMEMQRKYGRWGNLIY